MSAALSIRGLRKAFRRLTAVDHVDLEVPERCIFGLIGPNGAGKTTLFSLIGGFLKPDAGVIVVSGKDIHAQGLPSGWLGILPQDAAFERNVPILQQLAFFMRLQGYDPATARREVADMLEKVGLGDKGGNRVGTLSHGMAKRLALAQAFLGRPQVILLDEPTSGLDPVQSRAICDLIRAMRAHATVIVSSHNLDQLESLCDEIAILNRGKVIATGPTQRFIGSGRRLEMTLSAVPDDALLQVLRAEPGVESFLVTTAGPCTLSLGSQTDADLVLGRILRLLLSRDLVPRTLSSSATLESEVLDLLRSDDAAAPLPGARASSR